MCLNIIRNIYNEPVIKRATFGYKIIQEDHYGYYSMTDAPITGPFGPNAYYCYIPKGWMNSETDEDGMNFPPCEITVYKNEIKTNQTYMSGFHSYKYLYSLVDNFSYELINSDPKDETRYLAFKVQINEIITDGYEIGEDGYKNLVYVSKKIKLVRRIPQEDIKELYNSRRKMLNEDY